MRSVARAVLNRSVTSIGSAPSSPAWPTGARASLPRPRDMARAAARNSASLATEAASEARLRSNLCWRFTTTTAVVAETRAEMIAATSAMTAPPTRLSIDRAFTKPWGESPTSARLLSSGSPGRWLASPRPALARWQGAAGGLPESPALGDGSSGAPGSRDGS